MSLIAFGDLFPEVSKKETKTLTITHNSIIPSGTYSLQELYCPFYACKCAKVNIVIVNSAGDTFAQLVIGLMRKEYFDKRLRSEEHELPGPYYALGVEQSEYAEAFLGIVQDLWRTDEEYWLTILAHYTMMKITGYVGELIVCEFLNTMCHELQIRRNPLRALGRNDACYCGSGKKYKKCCLAISTEAEL